MTLNDRQPGDPHYAVFCQTKQNTYQQLVTTGRHNTRDLDVPNADPEGPAPRVLIGSDDNAVAVRERFEQLGIAPRDGAVLALELVLTMSREWWEDLAADQRDRELQRWVRRNLAFLRAKYGREAIVNAILHLDETTPHIHAIVLPIKRKVDLRFKDKAVRWSLTARDIVGQRGDMRKAITDYARQMERFGLVRGVEGSGRPKVTNKQYEAMLIAKIAEVDARGAEQDARDAALDERLAKMVERGDAARKYALESYNRSQALDARELSILDAKSDLTGERDALDADKEKVKAARADLAAREDALAEREAECARQRDELDARAKRAADWKTRANARKALLDEQTQELAKREKDLGLREANLDADQSDIANAVAVMELIKDKADPDVRFVLQIMRRVTKSRGNRIRMDQRVVDRLKAAGKPAYVRGGVTSVGVGGLGA